MDARPDRPARSTTPTSGSSPTPTRCRPFRELRESGELDHTVETQLVDAIIQDIYNTTGQQAARPSDRRLTGGRGVQDTIPALLTRAAERDPDGIWLRTDDGSLDFAATAGLVARTPSGCARRVPGPATSCVVTARNTPPYLLTWLGLAALGAVGRAHQPGGDRPELGGLVEQTRPRLLVTDQASAAGAASDARPGSAGRPGARRRGPRRRLGGREPARRGTAL